MAVALLDEVSVHSLDAQAFLGRLHAFGIPPVEKNGKRAVELLTPAAERGHRAAQELLGWLWSEGWTLTEREVAAAQREIAQISAKLQESLTGTKKPGRLSDKLPDPGRLLELMRVTMGWQDMKKAAFWYRQAADQGSPSAAEAFADIILAGSAEFPDPAMARTYYERAAAAGAVRAAFMSGVLSELGLGGPVDESNARARYAQAAGANYLRAAASLVRLNGGGSWTAEATKLGDRGYLIATDPGQIRPRILFPGLAGPLLTVEASSLFLTIADRHGRRHFASYVVAGDSIRLSDDADLVITVTGVVGGEADKLLVIKRGDRTVAMHAPPRTREWDTLHARLADFFSESGEAIIAASGEAPLSEGRIRLRVMGGGGRAIHIFDERHALSLPRNYDPINSFGSPLEAVDISVPNTEDLWADIEAGTTAEIMLDGQHVLEVSPPSGTVLRLALDPDRLAGAQVVPFADTANLPGSLELQTASAAVHVVGSDGRPLGTLFTQDDWKINGVVSPMHINFAFAGLTALNRSDWTEGRRAALVLHRMNLHRSGPDDPLTVSSALQVAAMETLSTGPEQASAFIESRLGRIEEVFGTTSYGYAAALQMMARLSLNLGQLSLAEALALRSLSIRTRLPSSGSDLRPYDRQPTFDVGMGFGSVANPAAMEPVDKLILDLFDLLAEIYTAADDDQRALLYKSRLLTFKEALDPRNFDDGKTGLAADIAELMREFGHVPESQTLQQYALSLAKAGLGASRLSGDYPTDLDLTAFEPVFNTLDRSAVLASNIERLARVYLLHGRPAEAMVLQKKALPARIRLYGEMGVETGRSYLGLAQSALANNDLMNAHIYAVRAVGLLSALLDDDTLFAGDRIDQIGGVAEAFDTYLNVLYERSKAYPDAGSIDDAFAALQEAMRSDLSSAGRHLSDRMLPPNSALAKLLEERRQATVRLGRLRNRLITVTGRSVDRRDAEVETAIRAEISDAQGDLARIENEFLALPDARHRAGEVQSLSLPTVRNEVLRKGELLILIHSGSEHVFLFAASMEAVLFRRLDISPYDLREAVTSLRRDLDLASARPGPSLNQWLSSFDVLKAHWLYRELFSAIDPMIDGAAFVSTVVSGPIRSFPLEVLLMREPPPDVTQVSEFGTLKWLGAEKPLAYAPSVLLLRLYRQRAAVSQATHPFLGIGDPLLPGHPSVSDKDTVKQSAGAGLFSSLIDFLGLRGNWDALPETADELKGIAATLGGSDDDLWLRERATEQRIIGASDLDNYKLIAFATHGSVGRDGDADGEPYLVLTPEAVGDATFDGYLSASEIGALKFDADLVILSACNSAASGGRLGSEGLSGLAKGFLAAGARNLLVTHWSVASKASKHFMMDFTKRMIGNGQLSISVARQGAIREFLGQQTDPNWRHPAFWGPFIIIGDGARIWSPQRSDFGQQ
ncbi:CHAT domain-containing protein/TPR repeat protein/tetratricopeptide (TPR) repeat protein [Skermanella aerolata]